MTLRSGAMTKPKDTQTDEEATAAPVVPQALQEKATIEANKAGNPGFPEDTSGQEDSSK